MDFDTSVEALIALFDGQVDQEVLEAMLAASDERVKSEASSPATPRPDTSSRGAGRVGKQVFVGRPYEAGTGQLQRTSLWRSIRVHRAGWFRACERLLAA